MSENELFIRLGLLTLFVSIVLLWYITRKRKEYFSNISQRELGVRGQFSNIIYVLLLIYISGYLLIEIIALASGVEQSISEMFRFRNEEQLRWPYIGLCFTVLCFAMFAMNNETLLILRMKDARKKLLLGELPEEEGFSDSAVTPTSSPIPPKSITESNEPATFAAVLQAMDLQLKQAVQAAEGLKSELDETKEKVVTLEIEVQEKDSEIKQIKESKSHFDKMILESSESKDEGDGKSLSITDSVMVGDSVMGGVKIDKQINNDPEAIARAVINAYRMGKSDE
jgi:FtsZ-binding cell division protein ZapB